MEPNTQSDAALQPPGRIPPVATGTATPFPPPAPSPAGARSRRIGQWVVNLAPFPFMVVSAVLAVASPSEDTRVLAFLIYTVSIFLIGLFLGLGRYRVGAAIGSGVSAQGREPSRAEILKNDERSERGSGPAAA